jgi:integrase
MCCQSPSSGFGEIDVPCQIRETHGRFDLAMFVKQRFTQRAASAIVVLVSIPLRMLVPKFKEKPTDITIYSPWEVTQCLSHSRPEMVPFLAIGAFAGLRSAEIERLDWSEVHLADKFIEIKAAKAKTASRRIVPITGNLAKWLKDHAKDEGRVVPFDNVNKQIGWLVEDTNPKNSRQKL